LLAAQPAVTSYPPRPGGQQGNLGGGVEARRPGFHGRVRRRSLAPVQARARARVCRSARAHAATGDQPADVRPLLGRTDATDVRNPLSWLRAPPHLREPKGRPPCRRPGHRPGSVRVRCTARNATVVSVPTCRRNRPAPGPRPGAGGSPL